MIAIKEKNVITIEFEGHDTLESPMLYQYDKGQKIKFLDVPDGAEVQFSNWATEMTKNKIVVNGQVEIPGKSRGFSFDRRRFLYIMI